MADDQTRLIISIETILRGLDKTLRGLGQVEKSLKTIAATKGSGNAAAGLNRAAISTEKLVTQQRKLGLQAQELANRQERARQSTERLALSQQRLQNISTRAAQSLGQQADAHVRAFRAIEQASRRSAERILAVGNSLRSIGQGLTSLGITLSTAVTLPLVGLGSALVNAATELDSLKRGLTAIAGSSDEAGRQLQRLTQIAKLPGIGFQEAIQGSIRLQAVGFSAKEAEKALREFSNAVALTGGGRDELNRVTVQLGQMAAKGKVLSQDLRPIIEAAPAVGKALREAFGTVNPEDIRELGLSTDEFLRQLIAQLGELPRAAAGAKNSFENFRDELFRAAATVGEALLPALTRLVEVVGPIITKLANAFAALPEPVQVLVFSFGGLLAAIGPIAFIVGQLTTGVGRLLVGLAQLNLLGILPTIKNLKAMTTGTLTAAQAQKTLAASSVLVAGAVGLVVAVVATAISAFALYKAFQKDSITLSKEQIDALDDQIKGLKQQAGFLSELKNGVERTANEEQRLLEIYSELNTESKIRVSGIVAEEQRLAALREELAKVIALREQERAQQAASLVGQLANNLLLVQANKEERDAIAARIQANAALIETLEREQKITSASTRALAERSITASTVEDAIGALKVESQNLSETQDELIDNAKKLNGSAREQAELIHVLEKQTGLTARQLLVAAKNMGVFRGDIEQTLVLLNRYIDDVKEATRATDLFAKTLNEQTRDLLKAGESADQLAKSRKNLIEAGASLAREASDSLEGALKTLNAFIAAQPRLREAIEREAQIQGKSFDEVVNEALEKAFGRQRQRSATGLRSAQEQLAEALAEVALASSEQQVKIEKQKNDRLLEAAEAGQRLQIISLREFLELRAKLTAENLDREIQQQAEAVSKAQDARRRLLAAAQKSGIPETERVRRQAQAAKADEEAIKAQTKLKELEVQREAIVPILTADLQEANQRQVTDIRQLEIRYAELQGRIEDALNAATVEEFRDSLKELTNAQEFLNRKLREARQEGNADRVAELETAQEQNQRQIEAINNQIAARDALSKLAAAEELVRRARERQQQLEQSLTFQVEFRGLKEEEAIRQRLSGEEKLQASLQLSQSIIEDTIRSFTELGKTPPPELQKFVDDLATQIRGLGELPFSDQFRLAEKEFTRLNDERLQRIADVERAVRNRDIAEAEGLLLIRRINGDYVDDLERQLELLKQIAAASGDPTLQRQAQDAAEVAKDAADQLATLNKQIRATSIDALHDGFTQLFTDLADQSQSATEDLLNFVNSVVRRINEVIAENLSQKLIESIFGGGRGNAGGGIIDSIKRIFGFGGDQGTGAAGEAGVAAANAATQQAAATAAAATLQTGASVAAATTTAAGVTFAAAVTTSAAAFAAAVAAAGAAFAAAVGVTGGAQALGGVASGIGNFATGDILPAQRGGRIVRVAEGGHPEAVLTSDPKHAAKQARLLSRFLRMTKGLQGRFPVPLAEGAIITPRQAELNLLSRITRTPQINSTLPNSAVAATSPTVNVRNINQINRGEIVRGYLRSAEGVQDILNIVSENAPDIGRRIGIK